MTNLKAPCPYCPKHITSTKLGTHIYSKHRKTLFDRESEDGKKNITKLHNPKRQPGDELCFHISSAEHHWYWCLGCKTVLISKAVIEKHYKDPECSAGHEECLKNLRVEFPLNVPAPAVATPVYSEDQVSNLQNIIYLLMEEINNKQGQCFELDKYIYRKEYRLWKQDPKRHPKPNGAPTLGKRFTLASHKLPRRLFRNLPFALTDDILKEKFHDEDDDDTYSVCPTEVPDSVAEPLDDRQEEDYEEDQPSEPTHVQTERILQQAIDEAFKPKEPPPPLYIPPEILQELPNIPSVALPSCVRPMINLQALQATIPSPPQFPNVLTDTKVKRGVLPKKV